MKHNVLITYKMLLGNEISKTYKYLFILNMYNIIKNKQTFPEKKTIFK